MPFCRVRCPYCDFATAPYTRGAARRFLDAVEREAGRAAERLRPRPFATVFLGGGTPSRLEPEELGRLVAGLRSQLGFAGEAEFTVEVNPEDVDESKLEVWAAAGVNRVSLGVQSWDEVELRRLGRLHGGGVAETAAAAVAGRFPQWSVDLIFGFPGHTAAGWRRALERTLALAPPHVSTYHFTPEAGTVMGEAVRAGTLRCPDEEAAAELFETGADCLRGAGYRHYEVSNFARPGSESRHNLRYWRREAYLGLGPGAVSFWQGRRWRNERDPGRYAARVLAGGDPAEEVEDVRAQELLEIFLLGLRLAEGVAWRRLREVGEEAGSAAAWEAAALRLAAEGWLETDERGVRVAPAKRRLTDEIVLRLWREAEPNAVR